MHQAVPQGFAKRSPMTAGPMQAMLFKHSKYPNAAKEYVRFMMEAPQYGPWLANCLGYWSEPLKAYAKMKFWTEDPKLAPYANRYGHDLLRRLRGAGFAAVLRGGGELYGGGYVRRGRDRQFHAGSCRQSRRQTGGTLYGKV